MRAETVHALLLMGILVGLAFSLYSAYETANPSLYGGCNVNSYVSCGKIATSGHTTTFGIQDYLYGIGGFVVLLLLDIPLYRTWKREWLLAVTVLSGIGAALSVYFGYLELAVIQGLCLICLGAYLSNVVVFSCALYLERLGAADRRATRAAAETPTGRGPSRRRVVRRLAASVLVGDDGVGVRDRLETAGELVEVVAADAHDHRCRRPSGCRCASRCTRRRPRPGRPGSASGRSRTSVGRSPGRPSLEASIASIADFGLREEQHVRRGHRERAERTVGDVLRRGRVAGDLPPPRRLCEVPLLLHHPDGRHEPGPELALGRDRRGRTRRSRTPRGPGMST